MYTFVWLLLFSIKISHILSNISKEDDFIYCIIQNTSWLFYLENTLNKAVHLVSSLIILWQRLLQLYGLLITVRSSEVKVSSELKRIPHQKMFQHFPYMMVKYPHGWDSLLLMLHISWLFVTLEATRSLSNLVTMSLPREIPGKNCKAGEIRFWCLSNDPASLLSFPCRLYLSLIPQQSPPIIPTQTCLPHLSLPTEPSSSGSHFTWHCCQLAPISTRWANQLHLKLWDAAVVPSTTKELQVSKTWSSFSASLECGGDVQTTALIPKQSFLLFSRVLVVYLGKRGDFVGRHSSVTHVASTPPRLVFVTAWLWAPFTLFLVVASNPRIWTLSQPLWYHCMKGKWGSCV